MAAIESGEVRLYKALSMGDDLSDGGGMSGNVVTSGLMNNVFPNISRADRITGKLQLRKTFMKLDNPDLEVYSGAHACYKTPTEDESVNVIMFDLGGGTITSPYTEFWDTNAEALAYIEDYYQNTGVVVGTAVPTAAISAGDTSITFKRIQQYSVWTNGQWQPYADHPDNYIETFSVEAGDCLYLVEGGDNEYVLAESINYWGETTAISRYRIYEGYVTINLRKPVTNSYTTSVTINSTAINSDWRAYGYMRASENFSIGDSYLPVDSTLSQILPVIYKSLYIEDMLIYDNTGLGATTFTDEYDRVSYTVTGGLQEWASDSLATSAVGEPSSKHYTKNMQEDFVVGSLKVQYYSGNKWHTMYDDGAGAFTSESPGSGTIKYTGTHLIILDLDLFPEPGQWILFTYQQSTSYLVVTDEINSTDKVATASTSTVILSFASTPIIPGSVRLTYKDHLLKDYIIRDDGAGALVNDKYFYFNETYTSETIYPNAYQTDRIIYNNTLWFCGSSGIQAVIGHSVNGSDGITEDSSTGNYTPNSMSYNNKSGASALFVVVGTSTRFSTAPTGAAWSTPSSIQTSTQYGITWSESLQLFISCGVSGTIFTSSDAATWIERTTPGTATLYVICADPSATTTKVLACGASGTVYESDDGIIWTTLDVGITSTIKKLWYDKHVDRWLIVANSGQYAYSLNTEATIWYTCSGTSTVFGTDNLTACHSDDLGTWYIAGSGGVSSSDDPLNVNSWNLVTGSGLLSTYTITIQYIYWDESRDLLVAFGDYIGNNDHVTCYATINNSDLTGTINYTNGTGGFNLSASDYGVYSDVTSLLYLTSKTSVGFTANLKNNFPGITPACSLFKLEGQTIDGTAVSVYEDPDNPPLSGTNSVTLIGDCDVGQATLSRKYGFFSVFFNTDNVVASTLKASFFTQVPYQSSYLPNLDNNRLPYHGKVSVANANSLCVVTNGTDYDMGLIISHGDNYVQLAGSLIHDYTSGEILVSTCVYPSDLVADEALHFGDDVFTVWSDTQQNGAPDGSYDWTNYPMLLDNLGATSERWYIKMKDVSSPPNYIVDIIGENLGTVETNVTISGELAPINSISGTPYWTLYEAGFDVNWKINEIERVNTEGAMYPFYQARVINAQSSDTTTDSVVLEIRGDISS